MLRPYTSMTKTAAQRYVGRMGQARALEILAICLHGAWYQRRFVIARVGSSDRSVESPVFDLDGQTLTMPIHVNDAATFLAAARSFGAKVERQFRDRDDRFEIVRGADDEAHIVHAWHHVALCGHSGPWRESPKAPSTPCVRCSELASARPFHRTRYHPVDES